MLVVATVCNVLCCVFLVLILNIYDTSMVDRDREQLVCAVRDPNFDALIDFLFVFMYSFKLFSVVGGKCFI